MTREEYERFSGKCNEEPTGWGTGLPPLLSMDGPQVTIIPKQGMGLIRIHCADDLTPYEAEKLARQILDTAKQIRASEQRTRKLGTL